MMKCTLPENWIAVNSKTHPNRIYYFNVKTKQSSWNEPSANEMEQVQMRSNEIPQKRRRLSQKRKIGQIEPTTPESDMSSKDISTRKKLVAKMPIKKPQEKDNEERETPQMKAIREKMLKKKEKSNLKTRTSKSLKDTSKSLVSKPEKTSPSVQKHDINSNIKTTCTPQMQVLIGKISKNSSKMDKANEEKDNTKYDRRESIKKRLRNQATDNQMNASGVSLTLGNKSAREEDSSLKIATVEHKNVVSKRKGEERELSEATPIKRNRRSLKKNLGKERMKRLRESLTVQYGDSAEDNTFKLANTGLVNSFGEKLPTYYRNAEVRLTRLKDKVIHDKSCVNKSLRTDDHVEVANSSKKSLPAMDSLLNWSNNDSLDEEMDWEPLEDEKITFEVQAVRTQLCTGNNKNTTYNIPSNTLNNPLIPQQQAKKHLYIVVDTNVFLSNIDTVELAKETIFKTYGHPLIVIPWTVIRELDYIKDDYGKTKPTILCVKARKAINYINKLFSSKHPHIITQTPEDVAKNKEKFAIDCPDDEILQTCLEIRNSGKFVVLLSYDVNLCNKAMIYDIVTLGRNDPFEKIDYLNASSYLNESQSGSGNRESLNSTSILSEEQTLSDEIYEDIKSIVRDFLAVIVSKEMHALYGEIWEKHVFIKPPWTTIAVLQCAIKHWIAAVSESFHRKAEVILKDLLQIFKSSSGQKTLKENSFILDKCKILVQMIDTSKHRDLMLRVPKKIDELKEKCQEFELQISERKLCEAIGVENNIEDHERRAQRAFQYFETAYVYARDMCFVHNGV
ncbi:swt1 RNA endoribonuclease isoform X2 [Xylocopa sonorina]|uniref:swt1 RNA endoribonuclease isoform X2 n=1 Tax=Xylocopa sonorina TaxID=1818115 RepID=UPI00403AF241